ncbi:hypothetical protein LEN26_018705 [Aphanomyces euteiches]|nr:hypothetical protein LEN26_018705 [Aphanomyces euteiches]KAH9107340.1 hypothetical protein AeMF1_017281 [Aphanomyces euteiches]KAH9197431.1 hypothetical protein AeNC1_000590 [Aphanomyces euteiches]
MAPRCRRYHKLNALRATIVLIVLASRCQAQTNQTCIAVKACTTADAKNCSANCPPCIAAAPNGLYSCVAKTGTVCPSTASTLCEGQSIFAAATTAATTASPSTTTASPTTTIAPPATAAPTTTPRPPATTTIQQSTTTAPVTTTSAPNVVENVSLAATTAPNSTQDGTNITTATSTSTPNQSTMIFLLIGGAVVGVVVIAAICIARRTARRSRSVVGSPLALETAGKPATISLLTSTLYSTHAPTQLEQPSRAFYGSDHEMERGSHSSVSSFQTESTSGFSQSIFQTANGKIVNLGRTSTSSLSSISSVFQVSRVPHPKQTSVVFEQGINEECEDPWAKTRDSANSIVMLAEGDEDEDLFDKDVRDMRATSVMGCSPRLFSECSSRFSDLSEGGNDVNI